MNKVVLILLGLSLIGCQQTQATSEQASDLFVQKLTGSFPCVTLTYQSAGELNLDGSSYKLGDAAGSYTFDGSKVVWTSGPLKEQFGDSVYTENTSGRSVLLQDTKDPSNSKTCKVSN